MKNLVRFGLMVMMVALALPATAGTWPHERDGFVIGFNAGLGSATAKIDGAESDNAGGGAGSFRLGWALNHQFLIGLESTAWTGKTDLDAEITLSSYKLNFTWYPGAKGWFLRTGFGGGSAELKGAIFGQTFSVEDSGGAFGIGGGHEWRLTRKFALGGAVDYNALNVDDVDFGFVNFTVQFNWYL